MTDATIPNIQQAMSDEIMEQAQVFASAWSLVGGPFDNGNMLENVHQEKDDLRLLVQAREDLITRLISQSAAQEALIGEHIAKQREAEARVTESLKMLESVLGWAEFRGPGPSLAILQEFVKNLRAAAEPAKDTAQ